MINLQMKCCRDMSQSK